MASSGSEGSAGDADHFSSLHIGDLAAQVGIRGFGVAALSSYPDFLDWLSIRGWHHGVQMRTSSAGASADFAVTAGNGIVTYTVRAANNGAASPGSLPVGAANTAPPTASLQSDVICSHASINVPETAGPPPASFLYNALDRAQQLMAQPKFADAAAVDRDVATDGPATFAGLNRFAIDVAEMVGGSRFPSNGAASILQLHHGPLGKALVQTEVHSVLTVLVLPSARDGSSALHIGPVDATGAESTASGVTINAGSAKLRLVEPCSPYGTPPDADPMSSLNQYFHVVVFTGSLWNAVYPWNRSPFPHGQRGAAWCAYSCDVMKPSMPVLAFHLLPPADLDISKWQHGLARPSRTLQQVIRLQTQAAAAATAGHKRAAWPYPFTINLVVNAPPDMSGAAAGARASSGSTRSVAYNVESDATVAHLRQAIKAFLGEAYAYGELHRSSAVPCVEYLLPEVGLPDGLPLVDLDFASKETITLVPWFEVKIGQGVDHQFRTRVSPSLPMWAFQQLVGRAFNGLHAGDQRLMLDPDRAGWPRVLNFEQIISPFARCREPSWHPARRHSLCPASVERRLRVLKHAVGDGSRSNTLRTSPGLCAAP